MTVEALFFQRNTQSFQCRQKSGHVMINKLLTIFFANFGRCTGFEKVMDVGAWSLNRGQLPVDQTHIVDFTRGLVVTEEDIIVPEVAVTNQRQRATFGYDFCGIYFSHSIRLFLQPITCLYSMSYLISITNKNCSTQTRTELLTGDRIGLQGSKKLKTIEY